MPDESKVYFMYFTTGYQYTMCSPTIMLERGTASSKLKSSLEKRDEAYECFTR